MYKKRKLPIGWKEFSIGDCFETGSGATPTSTNKEYYEGGKIPWINSGELCEPYIFNTSNFITNKGFEASSTHMYPPGTVLVAMYGATAGKASLLQIEACTNQAICAIKPNDDFCPHFIKYSIDNLYNYLVGQSSGSARDNLSQDLICKLKLHIPQTKIEQEHTIKILKLIDRKIALNRALNHNLPIPDRSSEAAGVRRAA